MRCDQCGGEKSRHLGGCPATEETELPKRNSQPNPQISHRHDYQVVARYVVNVDGQRSQTHVRYRCCGRGVCPNPEKTEIAR